MLKLRDALTPFVAGAENSVFTRILVSCEYARLLNDNQLTGEVPSSLGAFPIRGGVLK